MSTIEKIVITNDQILQLARWAGSEPFSELVVERRDGDDGHGLYAYNYDHPDEGSIFLDGGGENDSLDGTSGRKPRASVA